MSKEEEIEFLEELKKELEEELKEIKKRLEEIKKWYTVLKVLRWIIYDKIVYFM